MVDVNAKQLLLRLSVFLIHIAWIVSYIVQLVLSKSYEYAFKSVTMTWIAGGSCLILTLYATLLFGILLVVRRVVLFTFIRATMAGVSFAVATLMITCHDHVVILGYFCWTLLVIEVIAGRSANHSSRKKSSKKEHKSGNSKETNAKEPKSKANSEAKSKANSEAKSNANSEVKSKASEAKSSGAKSSTAPKSSAGGEGKSGASKN